MNSDIKNYTDSSRSMKAGILVGIGIMAAVDEIIFHQILAWHHFYDRATTKIGLLSDGLLHSAELIFIVAGFFMLLDLIRSNSIFKKKAWAGFFIGLAGFHLFDGIVDHKVLRLHQVRYVENILPYDLGWNIAGIILLVIGIIINRKANSVAQKEFVR